MKHLYFLKFIILLLLLNFPHWVNSANLCATTSQELHDALSIAQSNGQDDHIKIAIGTYTGGFQYTAGVTENFDIKITGGWSFFFGNPCGKQSSVHPFGTKLDGENSDQVLAIIPSLTSNIEISSLTFRNGYRPLTQSAAGLHLNTDPSYLGDVLIQYCAFFNNESHNNSALQIKSGYKLVISNNLFLDNHARNSSAIEIRQINSQINSYGVYFINNTVLDNTNEGNLQNSGLNITVSGPSQAFISNNILWGNEVSDLILLSTGFTYLYHNDIGFKFGSADIESGNFSTDPLFAAVSIELSAMSPLLNAGLKPPNVINVPPNFNETWTLGDLDILGNMRIQQNNVDIGAFESIYRNDPIFSDDFESPNL